MVLKGLCAIYLGEGIPPGLQKTADYIYKFIDANPEVARTAILQLRGGVGPEDMAQQLYMWALEGLRAWNGEGPQSGYLRRHLVFRMRNWLIAQTGHLRGEAAYQVPVGGKEESLDLRSMIRPPIMSPYYGLAPYQRYLIYMRFHEGLKYTEIGRRVKAKRHWVKKDINTALEMIRA